MQLDTGKILNNRYRIVSKLGEGGFGAVYRAWDLNLKAPCAVKINTETSAQAALQFAREASMLANLNHPNLPRVTDYFTLENEGQFLVMEFVDGENLQEKLERANQPGGLGHIAEDQALKWIQQIADALIYLHGRTPPIIHRDLKPANIRITSEGKAVLVDFGIAKSYDPHSATTVAAKAVTAGFSPPEQYSGAGTDIRSDIYALGATLYVALTGENPPESVMRVAGQDDLVPPREFNPAIHPAIESTILKAMELQAGNRFQRVDNFLAALKAAHAPEESFATQIFSSGPVVDFAASDFQMETQVTSYPQSEPLNTPLDPPQRKRARALPWKAGVAVLFGGGGLLLLVLLAAMVFAGSTRTNLQATQTALQALYPTSTVSSVGANAFPTSTPATPPPAVNALPSPSPTKMPTQSLSSGLPTEPPTMVPTEPPPTSTPEQSGVKVQIRNRTGGDANLYRMGNSGANKYFLGWLSHNFYGIYTFPSLGTWTIEFCKRDATGNDSSCKQKTIEVTASGQEFSVP